MRLKKIFAVLLCLALVLTLMPATALAAGSDFIITTDKVMGTDYTYNAGVLTIINPGDYTVSMASGVTSTTTDKIVVTGGTSMTPVNLTLNNVSIDVSDPVACAFDMAGATVNLKLVGKNTLKSPINAGLHCPAGATLVINGEGSLSAESIYKEDSFDSISYGAAGIGSNKLETSGYITINGGTVDATGGFAGAGIGGGSGGSNGTLTISGGTVIAKSNCGGAGIGGGGNIGITDAYGASIGGSGGTVIISGGTITAIGSNNIMGFMGGAGIGGADGQISGGNGANVYISGGSVNATGSAGKEAIGKASGGSSSGTLQNNTTDKTPVSLTTVTLPSITAATGVTALTIPTSPSYGTKDMTTDTSGKLYLYLPTGAQITQVQTVDKIYNNSLGSFTADTTKPSVTGTTPSGASESINGNIEVTFDEQMRTSMGAISLSFDGTNYNPLGAGSWSSNNTVYTTAYSGLQYNTPYTIKVESFQDYSGNLMDSDTTHSFTTTKNNNATLSSLSASSGTLSPAFSSGVNTYTTSVANNVSSLTVTPTASDANSSVKVNSTAVTSGSASGNIPLMVGTNTITVEVTAQDGTTKNTYTTTVTRAPASPHSSGGGSYSAPVYYNATATANKGGSISSSGSTSVSYGNSMTYTITADEGYEIEDVVVDGVSVGAVSTYTFKDVNKAHTITVSFKKKETKTDTGAVSQFADMNKNDWFYDSVRYVYGKGLMTGTSTGTFDPDGTMTRAMIASVLYRLSGDTGSYTNSFSDIASGKWYEQAAAWAAEKAIASGVGSNRFAPDNPLSREQLAIMLYNYAKYKGLDVSVGEDTNILSYNDALSISEYAYSALQWACGAGIISGDNIGNLNPHSSATRAEVAAMLQRFIENVIK